MDPTVSVTNLKKTFGDVDAVKDVSFEVFPGEIFGMLGPNGAGKTTTIRMILDIFKQDGGSVAVFGQKFSESLKDRIGYLPEERGLYRELKLEPTLLFLASLKGMRESVARTELSKWLERFDLIDHKEKKIQELSRGMQQKAQFIATLIHEPDLIIVDEPFSGLDPVNTRLVKDIILEQIDLGKTVIMSTHQMYQVEALCNRIVLINNGVSVLYGRVNQIKKNFAGNAVVVEGTGDFSGIPGVLDVRTHNGEIHLPLEPGTSPQDVFKYLAGKPDIRIDRFEISEPSLDDIFISVVSDDNLVNNNHG